MLFKCKQFEVIQSAAVFKITTDATLLGALAWNDSNINGREVLEVGSGTGIISLMLTQRFSDIKVHAIDKSQLAYEISLANFQNSKYNERLSAETVDVLAFTGSYDHIVINPPYFQDDTKSFNDVQKSSRHLDGLTYESLVDKLMSLVTEEGSVEIIHPDRYFDLIHAKVVALGGSIERSIQIRHNKNSAVRNCVSRLIKQKGKTTFSYFSIKEQSVGFSQEYIDLLRPFINV